MKCIVYTCSSRIVYEFLWQFNYLAHSYLNICCHSCLLAWQGYIYFVLLVYEYNDLIWSLVNIIFFFVYFSFSYLHVSLLISSTFFCCTSYQHPLYNIFLISWRTYTINLPFIMCSSIPTSLSFYTHCSCVSSLSSFLLYFLSFTYSSCPSTYLVSYYIQLSYSTLPS